MTHLKNWEIVLNSFYKLLKPKGMLWINCFDDSKYRKMPISLNKKINIKIELWLKIYCFYLDGILEKLSLSKKVFFWKDRIIFNKKKLEKKIKDIGFSKYIFCKRGCKDDLNEKIYKNNKLKKFYGSGDLRYMIYKL